jgi:hypothetical protein
VPRQCCWTLETGKAGHRVARLHSPSYALQTACGSEQLRCDSCHAAECNLPVRVALAQAQWWEAAPCAKRKSGTQHSVHWQGDLYPPQRGRAAQPEPFATALTVHRTPQYTYKALHLAPNSKHPTVRRLHWCRAQQELPYSQPWPVGPSNATKTRRPLLQCNCGAQCIRSH